LLIGLSLKTTQLRSTPVHNPKQVFFSFIFFSFNRNIFLTARKKNLVPRKKSWGKKKKTLLFLYQWEFSFSEKKFFSERII